MKFESIRIVLVATSHPGNIGSTARAMKTMGFTRLVLVSPKLFPSRQADELSAGSEDILRDAKVVDSLAAALVGCHLVIGTSARPRDIDISPLTPSECAVLVDGHTKANDEVAIVFGREHAGLTNDELLHCNYHVMIPSNPDYSSLNLAQAVQIIAYELRMQLLNEQPLKRSRREALATADHVEQFYNHLLNVLVDIDFVKLSNPKRLVQRIKRLFNRIQLEQREVTILRGILSNIQHALIRREKERNHDQE